MSNLGKYTLEDAKKLIKEVYRMNPGGIISKNEKDYHSEMESTYILEFILRDDGYEYVYCYTKTIEDSREYMSMLYADQTLESIPQVSENEHITRENISDDRMFSGESNYIGLYENSDQNLDELVNILNRLKRSYLISKVID